MLIVNMTDTISNKRADNGTDTVSRIPRSCPVCLLATAPPHLSDRDEGWCDRRFEYTEEHACDEQSSKIMCSRRSCYSDSPAYDVKEDLSCKMPQLQKK